MTFSRKLEAHLEVAKAYADLSHAKRLQVGAVLVRNDRPISVGYNGMPAGGPNECEDLVNGELVTKPGLVHAEMNVIAFAARNGVSTEGTTMVLTHSPCYECSKLIVQSGIKEVYYETEYRLTESLKYLEEYGIKYGKITTKE